MYGTFSLPASYTQGDWEAEHAPSIPDPDEPALDYDPDEQEPEEDTEYDRDLEDDGYYERFDLYEDWTLPQPPI